MAGLELSPVPINRSQISALIDQWQVQYSRFVSHSSVTSCPRTHPSLSPIERNRFGSWISTSGDASLKLTFRRSSTGLCESIIVLSLRSRVLEEHFITKLQFSWPQVSRVSEFPERGIKAVFMSYKDGSGQVQKFAVQFSTILETDKFMSLVKEIFKTESPQLVLSPQLNPEVSSQAEVISADGPTHSAPMMFSTSELNEAQDSVSHERIGDHEATEENSEFPPSFTQLVKNCYRPTVSNEKPTKSGEDLKTQFLQYLEGTSFTDLLATVEDVMNVLEGDLVL